MRQRYRKQFHKPDFTILAFFYFKTMQREECTKCLQKLHTDILYTGIPLTVYCNKTFIVRLPSGETDVCECMRTVLNPKNSPAEDLEIATLNFVLPVGDLCAGMESVLGAVLPALGCFIHYCLLIPQEKQS